MASDRPTTATAPTEVNRLTKYAGQVAGLVALLAVVSPFALRGPIGAGTPLYINVFVGVAILMLAGVTTYGAHAGTGMGSRSALEWSGWLSALAGLWVAVSPFALTGSIQKGLPLYSNVTAGVVVLVLAVYGGYALRGQ